MKIYHYFLALLWFLVTLTGIVSDAHAGQVKQGDEIKIITPGTVARLCPYPDCGQDHHITRIPEGTILKVDGIMDVKGPILTVKWFEVTYKEKRGWVSIYDTIKAP